MASKTVNGLFWSSMERISVQGAQFVLSLFIARILSPSDYGLVAMLGIFMAVAQTFVDSGFSNALIQKQGRTDVDYSTVFFFNIFIGIAMYLLLFSTAPFIASFYSQPQLETIIKFVGLNLILTSFCAVQRAQLTISLDFKKQAIIQHSSYKWRNRYMAGLSWLWCMDTGHPKFTHEFISFDITLGKYPVDSSPMFLQRVFQGIVRIRI